MIRSRDSMHGFGNMAKGIGRYRPEMAPEPHFQELVTILRRRRGLILATVLIGMGLALFVSLMIPPQYTAKAQIVFEPQTVANGRQVLTQSGDDQTFQTLITALTSRAYLTRVLDSLSQDPGFRASAYRQSSRAGLSHILWVDFGSHMRDWVGRLFGSRTPPDRPSGGEEIGLEKFKRHLNVYQDHSSYVITVAFTTTSPSQAALAANRIIELYLKGKKEKERAQLRRSVSWLDKRIPELRAKFERAAIEPAAEAAAAARVYEGLLQRRERLRAQQAVNPIDLRILSLASPPNRPSSLSPLFFLLPALIVFCTGGGFLAVAADRLDRSLHSAQDVRDALGIRCLGLVPLIEPSAEVRPHEYLLNNPTSPYAEAIRSVATASQIGLPSGTSNVILISSSVANEGKTTLAVSLAVYGALIGRRVLLMDLDFRQPSVSRELGGRAETGVLEALLLRDQSAINLIQRVPGLGLEYLPVGRRPDDPLLPYVGGHVSRLLDQLRNSYDCVIIDGPPLVGIAETRPLVTMADSVLLTIKWDSTPREVTRDAIDLLHELRVLNESGCNSVDAVLTHVDLKKHEQRHYGGWESIRALRGVEPRMLLPRIVRQ